MRMKLYCMANTHERILLPFEHISIQSNACQHFCARKKLLTDMNQYGIFCLISEQYKNATAVCCAFFTNDFKCTCSLKKQFGE